jgi:hypothetical protein
MSTLTTLVRAFLRGFYREVKEEVKSNPDLVREVFERLLKETADEGKVPADETLSLPDELIQLPPEVLERIGQVLEETVPQDTPMSEITTSSENTVITTAIEIIPPSSNASSAIMRPVYSVHRLLRLAKGTLSDEKMRLYIVGAVCVVGVIIGYLVYKKRRGARNN